MLSVRVASQSHMTGGGEVRERVFCYYSTPPDLEGRQGRGGGRVAGSERVATCGVEPVTDMSLFECTRMGSSAPAPAGTRWSSSMRRAIPPLPLSFSASVGSSKLTRTRSLPLPETDQGVSGLPASPCVRRTRE